MQNNNDKEIKEVKKILNNYKNSLQKDGVVIKDMILYGSFARGQQGSYSDIDVCIVSDNFSDNEKLENFLRKKVLEVDIRIEPIVYHAEDFNEVDPLVHEIKKYGVSIFSSA